MFRKRGVCLPLLQVLAQNSGYDPQETLVKLQTEFKESGQLVGVDLNTGESRKNGTRLFKRFTSY